MRTTIFAIILLTWLHGVTRAETVEMTTGPDLSINYDPAVWKPLSPLRGPEPGTFQSITWALQNTEWAQITAASHPERKKEAEFKRELLFTQKFRGDPAEFVREWRASLAGRDWLVLEFRNPNTRFPKSEIHYFLPTDDGHVTLFIIGGEADLPKHSRAIDAFLRRIHLK